MTKLFENKITETELEEIISKALNSRLLKLSDQIEFYKGHIDINKIIFCENFLHYTIDKKKKYPRDPWSLHRKIQYSILENLKDLFKDNGSAIDIASRNKNLLSFVGLNNINNKCLDKFGNPDYLIDIHGSLEGVQKNYFKYLFCFNFMQLSKNPEKALENMCSIMQKDGIAVVGFQNLGYWNSDKIGCGYNNFSPGSITLITDKYFNETILIPVGNIYYTSINYFCKQITKKNWRLGQLVMKILVSICKIEKNPSTAMEYIAVCKK